MTGLYPSCQAKLGKGFKDCLRGLAGALWLFGCLLSSVFPPPTLTVNSRYFDLQRGAVLIFVDVNRRRERRRGQRFFLSLRVTKQPVHAVLKSDELTEWIPPANQLSWLEFSYLEIW